MYRALLRPLLFLVAPDVAHAIAFAATAPIEHFAPLRALTRALFTVDDPRIATRVMGLDFRSPLGLAGGFDKDAKRPRALAALGFGHLELGTVTAHAQDANATPNMFRLPADRALVNRLGFPNAGAARVASRLIARGGSSGARVPVGLSIGKSRAVPAFPIEGAIEDYLASFRHARSAASFVVVNVSSPNTKDLRAMQAAAHARALLSALKAENVAMALGRAGPPVPLLVKIAPDLGDAEIEELLAVVEEVGLDGVVATNTTIERHGLATPPNVVDAIGAGGLSGPPLRARALDVVRRVRARLGKEAVVIGVGGVERAEHAMALIRAGANLVQMYTGFIYEGPGAPRAIARGLAEMVARDGARSIEELVGTETAQATR